MPDEEAGNEGGGGGRKASTTAAMVTMGANVAMIPITMNPLSIAAGAAGVGPAGYVIVQNKKLSESQSVREVNNELRAETNKLAQENAKLKQSVNMLEQSVARLKKVEEGLGAMAEQQGSDVNKLTELVKENQKTIDEMKRLMRGKVSQFIISTVLKSDDGDFRLDEKEVNTLCLRLNNIEGVTFKEEAMRQLIKEQNGSLLAVMSVVRGLLSPNAEGPQIFIFDIDDDEDDF
mmetsp:Transcript_3287/g.5165  ORF Transcript_3287/g.5165 Transcript_3287/m.5165 type:complete len:233 (-) Transcript_3287:302-1000(-)|eukprot:CAMPEP_0196802432 /NCGR_PEP_ID=MMETSP1362-20130617/2043_1 /TAXON_ID=163516 /ORGANISM="Leptocylindrus danicus, Strain CCMP1856" /LENGTH=232 /DNA_ID=CAMNT_0042173731 /DNA_START=92 /DNA_END=790 /DNA_ORIENTATION=+